MWRGARRFGHEPGTGSTESCGRSHSLGSDFSELVRDRLGAARAMSMAAEPDPEQLLAWARGGSALALGQVLEVYRDFLTPAGPAANQPAAAEQG
jgi:hypothetical protein